MELMSSLLLCALVALLPRTLGAKPAFESEIIISDMKVIGQTIPRKTILLKPKSQLVSTQSEFQSVFNDPKCAKCFNCMERAIRANKIRSHISNVKPNTEDLENDVIVSYYQNKPDRKKRDIGNININDKTNQSTSQRINLFKTNKTVTVTKYSNGGQIYAVRIQEGTLGVHETDDVSSTCEVYRVKKYFPCGSQAGESMLTTAKRKLHKRSKKEHERKTTVTTTEKAPLQTQSSVTKRQVDSSQMPENLMTSIEELY